MNNQPFFPGQWLLLFLALALMLSGACQGTQRTETPASPLELPTTYPTPILPPAASVLDQDNSLFDENGNSSDALIAGSSATILNQQESIALPTIDPLLIKDDITVGGSVTLYPLTRRLYRRFVREGYAGVMKIEQVGTGEGFRLLCTTGTADIVNAGRLVYPAEDQLCSSLNRTPVPFAVARAALVIFVHQENEFLNNVSVAELQQLLTATEWADVNPAWPARPIVHLLPNIESDEYAALAQLVMDEDAANLANRPNSAYYDSISEMEQRLAAEPDGLAIANHLPLLQEMDSNIRPVRLSRLLPDAMTVRIGLYPLVYTLYLYSDPGILRNKPQVAAFLNFYLNYAIQENRQVGFFVADRVDSDAARTELIRILAQE